MSTRVIFDEDQDEACLYCSVTGVAFGPLFSGLHGHDAREIADAFLVWLQGQGEDARSIEHPELARMISDFIGKPEAELDDLVTEL